MNQDARMTKPVDVDSAIIQVANSSPTLEQIAEETGLPLSDVMDMVEKLVHAGKLSLFRPTQTGLSLKPLRVRLPK